MKTRPVLRVAVLGAGTVGSEVVRALLERPDALAAHDGARLSLAGVAVRDLERARERGIPAELLNDAPAHLVASPDTDVVVELMGGDEPARTLIAAALGAGKPVVSANKHVIAHHGPELERTARRTGTPFRFEAAVGGGIPVLGPLASELAANHVRRVRGIVNGTTNYILSAMAGEGRPYADVLVDAQRLGYAEADPSGDVEGDDAVNKLVILARLAFGEWLDPATVVRRPPSVRGDGSPGITGITDSQMAGAAALDLAMKLLASATRRPDGMIAASVLATCVPSDSPFGRTAGVTNRIEIEGDPVGVIGIAGPGAGGGPTSSAVLADLIAIARGLGSTWAGLPPAEASTVAPIAAEPGPGSARRWFARLPAVDLSGRALPALLGQTVAVERGDGIAIRTQDVTLPDLRDALVPVLPAGLDVTLYPVDD